MTGYQDELNELREKYNLVKQLATTTGFYNYYFKQLPNHRTNVECFNAVNDLHLDLFGEYKYSSYKSFARCQFYKKSKK